MAVCLVIQHVEPEESYAIGEALHAHGVELDERRIYAGDLVPEEIVGYDGLVVMGGPMSARSDDGFPTRRAEVALLAAAVDDAVPTLGVCLGAQLLAAAGGAAVLGGPAGPEIGWAPVELLEDSADDPLLTGLPASLTVLHWHGDTFALPAGALHLAQSAAYAHQAFRLGPSAWGLQFHVEVTDKAVAAFLAAFRDEAESVPGGAEQIAGDTADALVLLEPWRDLLASRFAALVAARPSLI
jgi:GMP synthase-like glutamine amidotransferase